jgi:AcrR family transcriptional regulator
MSDVVTEPGLRERKRIATRRAILMAALQLVRERGLEATTVDEISRLADVSPRTFFNYFPSKEEALAGEAPHMPDAEAVERFVQSRGPLLADLGELFDTTAQSTLNDVEMLAARKELFHRYPHISAMRMEHFRHFEAELIEVVDRRLALEAPELSAERRSSRARLAVLICLAALRHAWMCYATSPEPDGELADRIHDSFAELSELLPTLLASAPTSPKA